MGMITRNFGPDHHTLTVGVDIPAGDIEFTLRGAQGADKTGAGGLGSSVSGTLSISNGDTLDLFVGAAGAGGSGTGGGQFGGGAVGGNGGAGALASAGGGGGAATELRLNGTDPGDRVAVAGGGGGAASGQAGGFAGHPTGGDGQTGTAGGTQTQDGAGGSTIHGRPGQAGVIGSGYGGGGGGGGWFGGAGGTRGTSGSVDGGGGGSSWTDPALVTGVTHTNGDHSGAGSASITYPYTLLQTTPWSGGVTESSAVIVAKTLDPTSGVDLLISQSSDLSGATVLGPETSDADGWVRLTPSGLSPDTLYYFGVRIVGGSVDPSKIGKFRTHPTIGSPHSFKIGIGADAGQAESVHQWPTSDSRVSNAPVFEVIRSMSDRLLFFAFYGDLHYRDIGGSPAQIEASSAAYRETYEWITSAPIRSAFHRDIPLAYIFDNHDSQEAGDPSGAESLTASGVDPTYRQCVPSYCDPEPDGKLWQSWRVGRVLFVMTDNRTHRTEGPPATMLGAEQKAWFIDTITDPSAALIVWIQSDPFTPGTQAGGWTAHTAERAEIGAFIASIPGLSEKLLTCTGHPHYSAYHSGGLGRHPPLTPDLPWNIAGEFPEFMINGMDATGGSIKADSWIDTAPHQQNFEWGTLSFDDDGTTIEVTLDAFLYDRQWGRHRYFVPPRPGYFDYGYHTWVVPPGVTAVHFDIAGAKGGDIFAMLGGHGARVEGTLAVTPGDTLHLFVGHRGQYEQTPGDQFGGGANGGTGGAGLPGARTAAGGGAATEIRLNGTAPANRVAVAGGGGGAARGRAGGGGGYPTGSAGEGGGTNGGGTQTQDGAGGTTINGRNGQNGDLVDQNGGGAGGGGYFGGGGGAHGGSGVGSGGGGSSWTHPSLVYSVVHTNNANPAPGTILLTWVE